MVNMLDRVVLAESVCDEWLALCERYVAGRLIDPSGIPDEDARLDGDVLVVFVPGHPIEMRVKPDLWRWSS